jgi:predicted Zn-dependent peptidase
MYSDNLTQKVAQAVTKIMDEELKGKQHKIDANKNGKVDAHDFKLLRAKKEVKEESEQIDELSKKTLGSYVKKAHRSGTDNSFDHGEDEHRQYGDSDDTEREKEMQKLKNIYENNYVNGNSNVEGIAENLASYYLLHGDINLINTEIEMYRSITAQEIREVAKKYLNPNQRLLLDYVPSKDKAQN